MSTREKLIKARLGMLALAEELSNVSLAVTCRCLAGAEIRVRVLGSTVH